MEPISRERNRVNKNGVSLAQLGQGMGVSEIKRRHSVEYIPPPIDALTPIVDSQVPAALLRGRNQGGQLRKQVMKNSKVSIPREIATQLPIPTHSQDT